MNPVIAVEEHSGDFCGTIVKAGSTAPVEDALLQAQPAAWEFGDGV